MIFIFLILTKLIIRAKTSTNLVEILILSLNNLYMLLRYSIVLLLFLTSCHLIDKQDNNSLSFTAENSIEKDLRPYNLPLSVRFPIEDEQLGYFKIQVVNELDGFVWYFKKGNSFQFVIEELGDDNQIYEEKVNKMLSLDFFASAVVKKEEDLLILHIRQSKENDWYYITRRIEVKGIYFMISTLETGVQKELYPKMLQTILSVTG